MKVLYLNLDRGIPVQGDKGASVHVRAFVSAAAALGHQVVLVCPTLGTGNPPPPATILHLPALTEAPLLAAECQALNLPGARLDDQMTRREVTRLAYDRTICQRVLTSLNAMGFQPDVIYERHALFHCAGTEIAARLDRPRILEVNAPLVEEQQRFRGLRLHIIASATEAVSYRGADAVVAVSRSVAQHVAGVLGTSDRVHTIPNGVDLQRFTSVEAAGIAIRRTLGLHDEPVVGFVGSFKTWHGMTFLLDAVAGLIERFPRLRLLGVGDGPEREVVQQRAAEYGIADRVILPGRIPHADIPAWLGAIDISVAPYLPMKDFYFSPLKIVESLAAGRPVIAPTLGEIGDVVAHGQTGLLYRPGDVASCQAALTTLLDNATLRRSMGAAGRQSVAGRDWRDVVQLSLSLASRSPARSDAA